MPYKIYFFQFDKKKKWWQPYSESNNYLIPCWFVGLPTYKDGTVYNFNMLLFEPLLYCLGRMFWVIVMLEDPSKTHFQCSHWGKEVVGQNFRYMTPFILPSIRWSRPVPLAEKHPKSIMFPPPCFKVGMVFLGLYSAFLFLQTRWSSWSQIALFWSHLTTSPSPKSSSRSSRFSLANFRRACTCAFFSRGTLRAQQDFNPSWCSVLLMVLFVTMVPTAFRSLTSSSCVFEAVAQTRELSVGPQFPNIG